MKFGDFNVVTSPLKLAINGFSFAPAEAPKIADFLSIAGSMVDLRALPPRIKSSPFSIEFSKEGGLTLGRESGRATLQFKFEDIDALIVAVNEAIKKANDEQSLISHTKHSGHLGPETPDITEGRG